MTVKELCNYYEEHQDEFPVKFVPAYVGKMAMCAKDCTDEKDFIAIISFLNSYVVIEICGWYRIGLSKECEKLQLDYDLDTPKGFLSAVVDCVCAELAEIQRKADMLWAVISKVT